MKSNYDFCAHRHWQYVLDNGLSSIYQGYTLSLDYYYRNALQNLHNIHMLLILLLCLEAVAAFLAALAYAYGLLDAVLQQRLLTFKVFLVLPSAVLRAMATKPCMVSSKMQFFLEYPVS